MKTIDLGPLIQGLLTFIGIAIATGQYGKLEHWARIEAAKSLFYKDTSLSFFAPIKHHSPPIAQKGSAPAKDQFAR